MSMQEREGGEQVSYWSIQCIRLTYNYKFIYLRISQTQIIPSYSSSFYLNNILIQNMNTTQIINNLLYSSPHPKTILKKKILQYTDLRIKAYSQISLLKKQQSFKNLYQKQQKQTEKRFYILLLQGCRTDTTLDQYALDNLTHYICRLIYCKTPQLKKQFVNCQSRIFQNKLNKLLKQRKIKQIEGIINELINSKQKVTQQSIEINISNEEFQNFKDELQCCLGWSGKRMNFTREQIFRFPFDRVHPVIKKRRCYLGDGFAYVHLQTMVQSLINLYQEYLENMVTNCKNNYDELRQLDSKDQLFSFIEYTAHNINQIHYQLQTTNGNLNKNNLPYWAKNSFPPCMLFLYQKLREYHHLKNQGRLILSLFLKGAGMKFEDGIEFWRQSFANGPKDFQKNYKYNIEWAYGRQGKKQDTNPYSCSTILKKQPKNNQYHGCFFKSLGKDAIRQFLKVNYSVNNERLEQIIKLTQGHQYQIACRTLFQVNHPQIKQEAVCKVGNHPNKYFEESYKHKVYLKQKNEKIKQQ